jgi:hypothetical protein
MGKEGWFAPSWGLLLPLGTLLSQDIAVRPPSAEMQIAAIIPTVSIEVTPVLETSLNTVPKLPPKVIL